MEINSYIEFTNLNNKATLKDIENLCNEAINFHYHSVCISPYYVPLAKELLKNTTVQICTTIGYPYGYSTSTTKSYEAIEAISNGADEIDLVINTSAIKNEDYEYIREEIEEIRDSIDGKILKIVINELNDEEVIKITKICNDTFINYIKTNKKYIELIKSVKNEVLEINVVGTFNEEEIKKLLIDDVKLISEEN